MERILHFEGFYFNNKTLDMAVVNPNGFQVPLARPPCLHVLCLCMLRPRACCTLGTRVHHLSDSLHGALR